MKGFMFWFSLVISVLVFQFLHFWTHNFFILWVCPLMLAIFVVFFTRQRSSSDTEIALQIVSGAIVGIVAGWYGNTMVMIMVECILLALIFSGQELFWQIICLLAGASLGIFSGLIGRMFYGLSDVVFNSLPGILAYAMLFKIGQSPLLHHLIPFFFV